MMAGNVILIAEDDENDVMLVKRACRKTGITAELKVVSNGEAALDYLLGRGEYTDRAKHPLPYLVLLDIKMPKLTGLQVLDRIKKESVSRIPIVVTSSSTLQQDIDAAYDLGANAYLVKPIDFEILLKTFQIIAEFFTRHAAKPSVDMEH